MKRVKIITMILALALLTACGKKEETKVIVDDNGDVVEVNNEEEADNLDNSDDIKISGSVPTLEEMDSIVKSVGLEPDSNEYYVNVSFKNNEYAFSYYDNTDKVYNFEEEVGVIKDKIDYYKDDADDSHKCYFVINEKEENGYKLFKYVSERHNNDCSIYEDCTYPYTVGYIIAKDNYFLDFYYGVNTSNEAVEGTRELEDKLESLGFVTFGDEDVTVLNKTEVVGALPHMNEVYFALLDAGFDSSLIHVDDFLNGVGKVSYSGVEEVYNIGSNGTELRFNKYIKTPSAKSVYNNIVIESKDLNEKVHMASSFGHWLEEFYSEEEKNGCNICINHFTWHNEKCEVDVEYYTNCSYKVVETIYKGDTVVTLEYTTNENWEPLHEDAVKIKQVLRDLEFITYE